MKRVTSLWLPTFSTDLAPRTGDGAAPFATVTEATGGVRLAAVDDAGRAAGAWPGQPLADARAVVPGLATAPARPEADARAIARLAAWARRYSPWTRGETVAPDGQAGLWLDVSGCAHLFGGEEAMLHDMTARVHALGFAVRAGLADTPGAAWAAARFMTGADRPTAVVPEGAARQLLSGLPVAALRLAPETLETLARLGLRRIEDLAAMPRAALAARFRDEISRRLDQMFGALPEPIAPDREVAPLIARLPFAEPIGHMDDIARAVAWLAERLCARLDADGLGARRLVLQAFRADGGVGRLVVGTNRASRDPIHLARLFAEKLETLDAGFGIDLMTLAAPAVEPLSPAQAALERRAENTETVARLLDRLGNRLGPDRLARPVPRARHVPERAQAWTRPVAAPALDARAWPRGPIRPVRLLPRPVAVKTDEDGSGRPAAFTWRRRRHVARRSTGPERISPEWWHAAAPPPVDRVRDYFLFEDEAGARFWLFARPDQPPGRRWFLHGVFG